MRRGRRSSARAAGNYWRNLRAFGLNHEAYDIHEGHEVLLVRPRVECGEHPLVRNDSIAALEQTRDERPIDRTVDPHARPSTLAVRRHEEVLITQQPFALGRLESKCDGWPVLDDLEGRKDAFARTKIGVAPRRGFARLGKCETQRPKFPHDRTRHLCVIHRESRVEVEDDYGAAFVEERPPLRATCSTCSMTRRRLPPRILSMFCSE